MKTRGRRRREKNGEIENTDKSELVDLDTSCTLVTDKVSELQYFNDEFVVKLDANFIDDLYRVVISREEA